MSRRARRRRLPMAGSGLAPDGSTRGLRLRRRRSDPARLAELRRGCAFPGRCTPLRDFAPNLPRAPAETRVAFWKRLARLGLDRAHPAPGRGRGGVARRRALASPPGDRRRAWGNGGLPRLHAPRGHGRDPRARLRGSASGHRRGPARPPARGGAAADPAHAVSVAAMRNLAIGQGQGGNLQLGERFTDVRRHAHRAATWGFPPPSLRPPRRRSRTTASAGGALSPLGAAQAPLHPGPIASSGRGFTVGAGDPLRLSGVGGMRPSSSSVRASGRAWSPARSMRFRPSGAGLVALEAAVARGGRADGGPRRG